MEKKIKEQQLNLKAYQLVQEYEQLKKDGKLIQNHSDMAEAIVSRLNDIYGQGTASYELQSKIGDFGRSAYKIKINLPEND